MHAQFNHVECIPDIKISAASQIILLGLLQRQSAEEADPEKDQGGEQHSTLTDFEIQPLRGTGKTSAFTENSASLTSWIEINDYFINTEMPIKKKKSHSRITKFKSSTSNLVKQEWNIRP